MPDLVILKLGGSAITKKAEDKQEVNEENLKRLAKEIKEAQEKGDIKLVIVHGAGPFGHVLAKEYGLDKGFKDKRQLEGFAKTHQSMECLNAHVVEALQKAGVNAIAYQPSAVGVLKNRKLVAFPTDVLMSILDLGMVPVAYGDVLIDLETGINILSGDHLVPYLAKKLKADRIVIATDVAGIFDGDPKTDKGAKPVKVISLGNVGNIRLGKSKAVDVTGGMQRKVFELLQAAKRGIESEVVSALEPGHVKKALLGDRGLGTTIKSMDK